ncbi:MAG: hypothetical protein A2W25_17105 [candidate division Zixibacteria bacterium RBG_16_53_22]|nr:MAG: hypothetical protein A2W25_17105 [candidate division Zixibacteria bacterium RBG_16_53_22]
MKARIWLLVFAWTLLLCLTTHGEWSAGIRVNNDDTTGAQTARNAETPWALYVDSSLFVQVVWEDNPPGIQPSTEVYYCGTYLRSQWGASTNVTAEEPDNYSPGHPAVTTYLDPYDHLETIVTYNSLAPPWPQEGNEYKRSNWDRVDQEWSGFFFISPLEDQYDVPRNAPGKSGELIYNGSNAVFCAWPYQHHDFRALHYRTLTISEEYGEVWSDAMPFFNDAADTFCYSSCVCPYPLPNHDMAIAYDRRNSESSANNIYYTIYHFADGTFDEPIMVSQAGDFESATRAYMFVWDQGNDTFTLHFVWEEAISGIYSVKYKRCQWTGESYLWSSIVILQSGNGRYPSLATTPDGTVYVVWINPLTERLYCRSASPRSYAWGATSEILYTGDEAYTHFGYSQLFADKVGNIHLVTNADYGGVNTEDVAYFLNDLPPVSPRNVAALSHPVHPQFKWSPCGETNFARYDIFRKLYGQSWEWIATVTGLNDTIYVDETMDFTEWGIGREYQVDYRVYAVDDLSQTSLPSATITFYAEPNDPKISSVLLPSHIEHLDIYPNPFNARTTVGYAIPEAGHVRLDLFDVSGRKVATLVDEDMAAGSHRVAWDARGMPSGVYMARLVAGKDTETRKMVLLK